MCWQPQSGELSSAAAERGSVPNCNQASNAERVRAPGDQAARARRLPVIRRLAMVGAARPLHQKILLAALFLWSPCALTSIPVETGLGTALQSVKPPDKISITCSPRRSDDRPNRVWSDVRSRVGRIGLRPESAGRRCLDRARLRT